MQEMLQRKGGEYRIQKVFIKWGEYDQDQIIWQMGPEQCEDQG